MAPVSSALVSVVVPTRDRWPLLARTLSTVLEQRGVDLEVVVVDEASSDGTAAGLAALADPRVRTVRHLKARGVSAARNTGIGASTGAWVAFLDDDDLWAPDKLQQQLKALAEAPAARWCTVGAVKLHEGLRVGAALHPPAGPDLHHELLQNNVVAGGCSGVLVARSLVEEVGGFDERLSTLADWDYWTRLSSRAPCVHVDRPLVGYNVHPRSMSHDVTRSERELALLATRYAAERAAAGVEQDRTAWARHHAQQAARAGDRRSTLAYYRELRARGALSRKGVARALWTTARPAQQHRWDARAVLPPGWEQDVEAWLAPLRQGAT